MTVKVRLLAVVLAAVTLAMPMTSVASAAPPQKVDVIVVLHDGVDARGAAQDMARSHGAELGFVYEHALRGFSATVPEGRVRGLEEDPRVVYVEPNHEVHALEYPTGVRRIDADPQDPPSDATGDGVRVAVIDTGIDLDHPDLTANIDSGSAKDCITEGGDADDDAGHGTHVAGTIAANGGANGVMGVAPQATLVPVKVLDSAGSGTWDQVICGIDHVASLAGGANEIDVANMSLGGAVSFAGMSCDAGPQEAMFDAICAAVGKGVTFAVAAGNDGRDAAGFAPASHPEVITVSAWSDDDGAADSYSCIGRGRWKACDEVFASFSNYGSTVDVTAPGVDILSTTYEGNTGTKSGTSMASPHVAGVAALVLEKNPALTPAAVLAKLQATGQCPDHSMNTTAGACAGQTWRGDPDGIAEPMVNAYWAGTVTPGGGGDDTGTAPAAPSGLIATAASSSEIGLSWTDNSDNEDNFDVQRSTDGTEWSSVGTVGTDQSSFSDTDVTANTTYSYRVRATNSHGVSSWSGTASATTLAEPSEPSSDISLSAQASKVKGEHVVTLNWSGASGNVDISRDDVLLVEDQSETFYTHETGERGSATYRYQVCPTGSDAGCSNEVTVTF